jgi:OOP family OmpA-OmpF porin
MKKHTLVCALALTFGPAWADHAGHWYVAPQVGAVWPDDYRDYEERTRLLGLSVGKHVNSRWSAEVNYNDADPVDSAQTKVDLRALSFDTLRIFRHDRTVSPYVTVGMGAVHTDAGPGASDTDFMAQGGGGLLVRAWRNEAGTRSFSIRPELKARWVNEGSAGYFRDYLGTVSFQFSFGRPAATAAPPPSPAPAAAPSPAPVPPDSDGDGVADASDRCPGTPLGTKVDANGCPYTVTLGGVNFAFDSAQLTPESRTVLDSVAAGLAEHPRLRVEMQGHTDSVGSEAYNMSLSQRRADAVRNYVISRGVPAAQVEARGYGESRPVADNRTAEGRARNRRVDMRVLDNPDGVRIEGAAQPSASGATGNERR